MLTFLIDFLTLLILNTGTHKGHAHFFEILHFKNDEFDMDNEQVILWNMLKQ